jgi:hypothetical protein
VGGRRDHVAPFRAVIRLWTIALRGSEAGRINGASLARSGRGIRRHGLRDGIDLTYFLLTEHASEEQRAVLDSSLLETPDDRERREVMPLIAAMGGLTR